MFDLISSFLPKELPAELQLLVEPAKKVGIRLGDAIADSWDSLVDRLFGEPSKTAA